MDSYSANTPGQRDLRVLLDGRKLGDGGIGVYINNLIHGLKQSAGVALTVLTTPERNILVPKDVCVVIDSAKNYSFDELVTMPKRLNLRQYDLFHSPHFMLPLGLPIPSVVTIHDTIHLDYPEKWIHSIVVKRLIKSAMNRASRILTVSAASRDSLVKLNGEIKSKIDIIPNALSESFLNPSKSPAGINGAYAMGVFSNTKPHKGLADLLLAFDGAQSELKGLQLVLVGSGLTNENTDLHDFAEILSRPEVTILGEVSDSWLRALYAGASFVVAPSLAEGFGLPVLEAKSQGAPILARPTPAILELLDDSDIVCADNSVEELAQGLIEAVERYSTQASEPRCKIDLNKFSTLTTAAQVLEAYRSVVPKPLKYISEPSENLRSV